MEEGRVGDDLADGLDGPAVEALTETAVLHHRDYDLDRWLVNGRSRAPVAIVLETDHRARTTRRLLLKVPTTEDTGTGLAQTEYARHQRAWDEAPSEFAKDHLTEPVGVVRMGQGRFVTFQAVAGDDVESVEVLTVLLNSMLGTAPGAAGAVPCSAADFARICAAVVAGVLEPWNGRPRTARRGFTVAEFLASHIFDQTEPGGRLHAQAMEHRGDRIRIDGEDRPLVNPFALARGALFGDRRLVRGLVGRTHGDLHTDNVLVRVRPAIDAGAFHLIDLALYEPDGPMTRDPAHLLLYILARRMDTLSALQQEALLEHVIEPHERHTALLPGWLTEVIAAMDGACLDWLKGSGLQPEWRRERLLSLAGCAMLFLGRRSTDRAHHPWFLRLAARAADRFVSMPGVPPPAPDAAPPAAARPPAWSALPAPPPVAWVADLVRPRTAARTAVELHLVPVPPAERLSVPRLAALRDDLVAAGRTARLFGDGEEVRQEKPGTAAGGSGSGLAVTRTGQRSAWTGLPHDDVGAVLDRDDLAARLRALLDALLRVTLPGPDAFGIAVGIETGGLVVSEGRAHGAPDGTVRSRVSAAPLRLPAEDALARHELARGGSAVAGELAERILFAFRQGTDAR